MSKQAAPPASYSIRSVADLVPYARNARTHSDVQVAQIAASIKEFGFINPVIIEADGGIIAGHGRVLAAHKLGLTQVPTLEVGWLSEAQKRAYILADNKLAENAGWDADMLRIELQDLKDLDFDISLTGFADLELTDILAARTTGNSDPDDVPEEQAVVITDVGDVWVCGRHRIICGDSTNPKTVEALLGLVKPHLMVTDPPYGVEYDPKWRAEAGVNNNKDKMGSVANDDRADWREAWALFPGNVCYIWHAGKYSSIVQQSIESVGFEVRSQIIWAKDRFALSRGHYHWQHEPCQPAGTMVRTPSGEVPIESLKDGDSVLSYDSYSGQIVGKREGGRRIKVACRHYQGTMYTIHCGGKSTKATDGHKFTVRFAEDAADVWCTYLMRRGDWWRVGILRVFNSRGFGPAVRVSQESADEMWILGTHANKNEASCAEQVLSVKYGIPTTHWNVGRSILPERSRTTEQVIGIYEALDLRKMACGAEDALRAFGRSRAHPIATCDTAFKRHSRRVTVQIHACNIIPEIMELPIPHATGDSFDWKAVYNVDREHANCPVYSLDVEKNEHYIADGIVTHNCLYCAKGANAHWSGDRSQSTVWNIKSREDGGHKHGTQKPVECMRKPIENNSSPGQAVYDPFGGSGTTMIAAEATGRCAYLIELNPSYVDVTVRRWQTFAGAVAVRESDGLTFEEAENGRTPRTTD